MAQREGQSLHPGPGGVGGPLPERGGRLRSGVAKDEATERGAGRMA